MAAGHPRIVFILCALLLIAVLGSCAEMRGPGIVPHLEDSGLSEWNVLNTGFLMVRTNSDKNKWKWQIIARYIPEALGQGLKPLDITAAIDGVQVPFTFEEDSQIFECMNSFHLNPGKHTFELIPSENSSRPFPTLMVEFEAP